MTDVSALFLVGIESTVYFEAKTSLHILKYRIREASNSPFLKLFFF